MIDCAVHFEFGENRDNAKLIDVSTAPSMGDESLFCGKAVAGFLTARPMQEQLRKTLPRTAY